jgi:dephospho-CoA kinase
LTRPVAVAITGGIGAGKSEALAAFARHGAATLSADQVVHDLIARDPEVRSALQARFGSTDRADIGKVVFADRGALAWLEQLLHPRVVAIQRGWLETVDAPVAVVEIPLLYETGGEARFDKVVVVTAPAEVRAERRRPPADDRDARLLPDEEKVARADYAYVNDGTLEQLDAWVAGVMAELCGG